jgi:hypothetical protein
MTEIINASGDLTTKYTIKNGVLEIRTFQDIEPIIEANKAAQNNSDFNNGYTPSRDLKHVASIPRVILNKWAKESGLNVFSREFGEYLKKKLNDPDNKFLRTGLGEL